MTKYRIDIPSNIALMGFEVVEQYIKLNEQLQETRSRIREISIGLITIDKAIVERMDSTRVANITYWDLVVNKRLIKAVETKDLANQKYEITIELLDLKELEENLIHKLDTFRSWAN